MTMTTDKGRKQGGKSEIEIILINAFFFILEITVKKTKSLKIRKCTSLPFFLKAVYMGEDYSSHRVLGTLFIYLWHSDF